MTIEAAPQSVLTDEMLQRFAERAPVYDKENRFFQEDFDELKAAGYLNLAVPKELGGPGYSLAQICQEQRRLAYYAPATALGANMHFYFCGLAADVWRSGDKSLEWLLNASMEGEVFAAGHAEHGNDVPLLLSTTKAERVDGGYRFTGHKSFTSMTPVWTFLGLHGMDTSDPDAPKIVHAFMPRDTDGYRTDNVWDVLGMRATQSWDTILEGVVIPDKYIARVVPAGAGGLDLFVLSIFSWALLNFGNIYYGLAQRAFDLIVEDVKKKTSLAMSRPMSYHAEVQHGIAEMVMELDAIGPHLDRIAEDWSNGIDHGATWPSKILVAKHHAVEGAFRVVDRALDLAGGFGIFAGGPYERMFRDVRLGRIHPGNQNLTFEFAAKTALGISPDETPRWG